MSQSETYTFQFDIMGDSLGTVCTDSPEGCMVSLVPVARKWLATTNANLTKWKTLNCEVLYTFYAGRAQTWEEPEESDELILEWITITDKQHYPVLGGSPDDVLESLDAITLKVEQHMQQEWQAQDEAMAQEHEDSRRQERLLQNEQ